MSRYPRLKAKDDVVAAVYIRPMERCSRNISVPATAIPFFPKYPKQSGYEANGNYIDVFNDVTS